MKRLIFAGIGAVLLVLLWLAGVKAMQIRAMMAMKYPAQVETISSAVVREEKWQDTLTAVGSVDPQNGVTLAPEIAGTVKEIAVVDGSSVAKGDLLLRMDTSSEEAQLRAAEAQTEWARVSAERLRKLREDKTVSQSELDQAEASLKQAQANADAISAIIGKKTIRAPFAGKLGIWLVNVGASVDARRPLISLHSLAPVYVDFSLPQQNLALVQTGLTVQVTCDAYPGRKFSGALTAINPDLDAATRSVTLRATFENKDELLRPGMFAHVEVILPEAEPVLAIPATAVLSAPFGDSVFVIEQDKGSTNLVVEQKIVRTGRTHGDFISIESGLKAGDKVATAGIFKLRNGVTVVENNEDMPKPSLSPNPPNS